MMITTVNITRNQRHGAYGDILEFLSEMAGTYGSATNSAAVLLRGTPEFHKWDADRKAASRNGRKRKIG